jgi:hypothetical protein
VNTIALVLLLAAQAAATPPDSLRGVLVVTADVESAVVSVNGLPAGQTPLIIGDLPPGPYAVDISCPSSESWFLAGTRDTVQLVAGDTTRVSAHLQHHFQVMTEPAGLPVYAGDSLAGVTPLLLPSGSDQVLREMTLRPPGASPVLLLPPRGTGLLRLTLPLSLPEPGGRVLNIAERERGIPLQLVATGGAALLSGVAAATWKVRADGVYAEYRLNRDPAARERTRRLDTSAAVALVAMQVSLGLFVYFLLSE